MQRHPHRAQSEAPRRSWRRGHEQHPGQENQDSVPRDILPLTLQPLLFRGKKRSKGNPQKSRVLLFAEPLNSLENKGKRPKKREKTKKQKKQGNRKKQGLEGQGFFSVLWGEAFDPCRRPMMSQPNMAHSRVQPLLTVNAMHGARLRTEESTSSILLLLLPWGNVKKHDETLSCTLDANKCL